MPPLLCCAAAQGFERALAGRRSRQQVKRIKCQKCRLGGSARPRAAGTLLPEG